MLNPQKSKICDQYVLAFLSWGLSCGGVHVQFCWPLAGRFVTRYSSCSVCIYLTYFKSDAVLAGLPAIVFSSFKLSPCFYSARIPIWVKTLEVNQYFEVLPCQSYRESGKSKKLLVDVNYNKPIAKAPTSVTIPVQLVKVRISRTWTNCEPVTELCSLSVGTDNIKLPSSANLILDEHCCNCGLNNR